MIADPDTRYALERARVRMTALASCGRALEKPRNRSFRTR